MWYAKVYVSIMSKVKRFSPRNKLISMLFYSHQACKCIITEPKPSMNENKAGDQRYIEDYCIYTKSRGHGRLGPC